MSRHRSLARLRVVLAFAIGAVLVADGAALAIHGPATPASVLTRGEASAPSGNTSTTTAAPGDPAAVVTTTAPASLPGVPPTTRHPTSSIPTVPPVSPIPIPLPPKTTIPSLNIPVPPPTGLWPAWGPAPHQASRPILFTRDGSIDVINPDGMAMHQLASYGSHPSWSANGTQIVFRGPESTSSPCPTTDLYVMNADGTGQHRLPATPGTNLCADEREPSWSPDGARIAYIENGTNYPPGLYVVNTDGTGRRLVCACVSYPGQWDDGPSWSPDGTHLLFTAYEYGAVLYMIGVDGSGKTRLASHARSGHWSRNGDVIVFTYDGDNSDSAGIALLDRNGGVHRLTTPRPYVVSNSTPPWAQMDAFPQWAPDDSAIVFSSNRDHLDDASGHLELFVIKPDGTNVRKITSRPCCSTRSIDWPAW